MSTLDDWVSALSAELGLDPVGADSKMLLDLTKIVAHQVDRPAAPLTTYLLGIAVGRGQSLAEAAQKVQQLARDWPAAPPAQD
jgi:hypothetical protein